jgi:alpha-glucosidase (family GH31 glycosyl hydrolase)
MKLATDAASPGLWGLGDHYSEDIFVPNGIYSQWNRDDADPLQSSSLPASNTYGTHPFFMFKSTRTLLANQNFVGVFLKNINAADFHLYRDATTGEASLNITTTGGKIEYFFMMGEKPEEVV